MKKRRSLEYRKNSDIIDFEKARKERAEKRKSEALLEEKKRKEKEAARPSVRKRKKKRKVIIVIGAIGIAVALMFSVAVWNIVKLKAEEGDAVSEQNALKEKKTELKKELKKVNQNEYIEKKAREQLRMVKPGEKLFIFEKKQTDE